MAGLGERMSKQHSAVLLCSLLLATLFPSIPATAAGPPAQIVISTPSTTISSDGVLQMEATLYDALNNVADGEITWSASNGTIEQSGLFFPWSAGQVTVRADHGGFNDTVVVTVVAGFGQSIEINTTEQPRAKFPFTLQANLIDSHDNPRPGNDVVWTVDGTYIGQGEPAWTPPSLGLYEVVARYDQLEKQVIMEAIAGDPYEFVFPENLILRSGEGLQLYPDLIDSYGQKMNNTLAGNKVWDVENGTITPVGYYYASAPGICRSGPERFGVTVQYKLFLLMPRLLKYKLRPMRMFTFQEKSIGWMLFAQIHKAIPQRFQFQLPIGRSTTVFSHKLVTRFIGRQDKQASFLCMSLIPMCLLR